MKRILFVCTGNTCRSPMAEALLRYKAGQAGLKLEVRSAGVAALGEMPIADHAVTILQKKGITEQLQSQELTKPLTDWADLILTMTMGHKQHAIQRFPQIMEKIYTLKEYANDEPQDHSAQQELTQLMAELQVKQALSQEITEAERDRLQQLADLVPDYDIADPFGGSLEAYHHTAQEIEQALDKLLRKWQEQV